ncbi:MAG: hypothetical protein NVSMB48_20090 [Marmoricola sp.]
MPVRDSASEGGVVGVEVGAELSVAQLVSLQSVGPLEGIHVVVVVVLARALLTMDCRPIRPTATTAAVARRPRRVVLFIWCFSPPVHGPALGRARNRRIDDQDRERGWRG